MKRLAAMAFLLLLFRAPGSTQGMAAPKTEPTLEDAADAGTQELIEGAKDWDGRLVVFQGEAIGDPMDRGAFSWVNVLDPNAAMGVWMTAEQVSAIGRYGSYRWTGDSLRIVGIFHRACPEHGGDMDIHATKVAVISAGAERTHPVDSLRAWLLFPVIVAAAVFLVLWRRREAAIHRHP